MQPSDIPDKYFEKVIEIIKTKHYDNWKFLFRQKKTKKTKKTSVQNKVEDNEETGEEDNEETTEENAN